MKTFTTLTCTLFLFFSGILQAQVSQQVTYSVNDVTITQENDYDVVDLPKTVPLYGENHVGQPQLPVASLNIALPKNSKASSVTITIGQQTAVQGNYELPPVQLPRVLGNKNANNKTPVIKKYCANTPFPETPLLSYANHQYREYSYVTVNFIPFTYNAQSGQLALLAQLTIAVSTTTGSTTVTSLRPKTHFDQRARQNLKKTISNPQKFEQFYTVTPPVTPLTNDQDPGSVFEASDLPSEYGSQVPYVIITNNTDIGGTNVGNLVGKFQEFADWKTRKGTPAKVVTVDAIENAYPGSDVPEKIRDFIQDTQKPKINKNQTSPYY